MCEDARRSARKQAMDGQAAAAQLTSSGMALTWAAASDMASGLLADVVRGSLTVLPARRVGGTICCGVPAARVSGAVALQCGNANIAARGTQSLCMRQAAESSLHASYNARHEPAGRRHRKHSVQPSREYDDNHDDDFQVGAAFHAQMLAA